MVGKTPKSIRTKMQSFTVEDWYNLFQIASAILAMLTFGVVTGTVLTGRIVNKRRAERIANLEQQTTLARTELAGAKEKQAIAEERLELLRKNQEPRGLVLETFTILGNGPKGSAEIFYQREDMEAYELAKNIYLALAAGRWTAARPVPLSPMESDPQRSNMPSALAAGAQQNLDVTIITRDIEEYPFEKIGTPYAALHMALNAAGLRLGSTQNSALQPDHFSIIVSPKAPRLH